GRRLGQGRTGHGDADEQGQAGHLPESLHLSLLVKAGLVPCLTGTSIVPIVGYISPKLYPGIPFIATVFPIAALPAGDVAETFHNLNTLDIFGMFVAELA